MPKYNNIPVDTATKKNLIVLATRFGFGERGQGAVVRMLVNEKLQRLGLAAAGPTANESVSPLPAGDDDAVALPAIDDVA